jgi:hypothetical protein
MIRRAALSLLLALLAFLPLGAQSDAARQAWEQGLQAIKAGEGERASGRSNTTPVKACCISAQELPRTCSAGPTMPCDRSNARSN